MLTPDEVRILDLNSAWHGVPPSILMKNAGRAVADAVVKRFAPSRVLVLAGWGNNGGDGAVAAQHLAEGGVAVTLLYATGPERISTDEARLAHGSLDSRRVRVETYRGVGRLRQLLSDADVVVDALLGVGVSGELREPIRSIVRATNAGRRTIVSVDVPTGLGGRFPVRPKVTVTLHDRKRGMRPAECGSIVVRDIGIPAAAVDAGPGDLAVPYRRRKADSHKGENGRLLVVSGGPYCGAPLLAATAALRTGVDLVRLYTPGACARAAMAYAPDLIVHPGVDGRALVPEDLAGMEPLWTKVDAVLVGPGLGLGRPTQRAIAEVLRRTQRARRPLVLDADALAVAGRHPDLLRRRPVLATPHAREFRDLTGRGLPTDEPAARAAVARAARRLRSTLLVKGPTDWISDGRRTKANRIHHAWMTAGGTGDALAGVAGALLALGLEPFRAAAAAAFLNGAAGLRAFEARHWGARATDLVEAIPTVLRDWVPATAAP